VCLEQEKVRKREQRPLSKGYNKYTLIELLNNEMTIFVRSWVQKEGFWQKQENSKLQD